MVGERFFERLPERRDLANLRERRRMMLINGAFNLLRDRLPICELLRGPRDQEAGGGQRQRRTRLTKVDILRLTIEYIRRLGELLGEDSHRFDKQGDRKARSTEGQEKITTTTATKDIRRRRPRRAPSNSRSARQTNMSLRATPREADPDGRRIFIVQPAATCSDGTFGHLAERQAICYSLSWSRQRQDEDDRDHRRAGSRSENVRLWVPERLQAAGDQDGST